MPFFHFASSDCLAVVDSSDSGFFSSSLRFSLVGVVGAVFVKAFSLRIFQRLLSEVTLIVQLVDKSKS